jgi:CDP-diacylglycerol---glycerol-3-phosphate 3-phosphatidyltransferase
MARRPFLRKRFEQKEPVEPVSLPASIAWSTIAALLLLGVLQTFGNLQPHLETTFGLTSIILIPLGGLISLGIFKLTRKRADDAPAGRGPGHPQGILEGDVRAWWISVISPLENALARRQWNPNFITSLSFGFSLVGCVFFYVGWLFLAGWMILFAGTLDMLDGRIARKTGRVSRRGAFFDSVLDRYGELFIFLGLAAHLRHSILLAAVLPALAGSLMVSYARARAEGVGVTCKVGMMQRPERIVFMGFGAIFSSILYMLRGTLGVDFGPYLLGTVLFLIAVLSNLTAVSRIVYVMRVLKEEERTSQGPKDQ